MSGVGMTGAVHIGFDNVYTFNFPESMGVNDDMGVFIGAPLSSEPVSALFYTLGQTATALSDEFVTGQGATSGMTITVSTYRHLISAGNRLFMYTLTGGSSDMSILSTSTHALTSRYIFAELVLLNTCNQRYDSLINQYIIDNPLSSVSFSGNSASPAYGGFGGY